MMHAIRFVCLIFCFLSAQPAMALDRDQAKQDILQAVDIITTRHAAPFVHINQDAWKQVVMRSLSNLPDRPDDMDVHRSVAEITDALRCAHSFVNPSESRQTELQSSAAGFPLDVEVIGGRIFVSSGRWSGREIETINGLSAGEVLRRIRRNVRIDGYGEVRKDREVARRFAYHYAVMVDPRAEMFAIDFVDGEGTILLEPKTGLPSLDLSEEFLSIEKQGGVTFLTVRGFYDRDAEGQFADFINDAAVALTDKTIESVVLDLRGNPGGIDAYGVDLVGVFATSPFRLYDRITTREALADVAIDGVDVVKSEDGTYDVLGADGLALTRPRGEGFKGRLVILVDSRTGSTATDVASHLHAFEGGILVGEETTGAYNANSSGYLDMHSLTHSGVRLYIPRWRYVTSASREAYAHRGVVPDIPMSRIASDLSQHRDRLRDAALSIAMKD